MTKIWNELKFGVSNKAKILRGLRPRLGKNKKQMASILR